MKPTHSLCARLRFSTKDVAKGFYRGNRTGSTGAHTPYGGYVIDYRKVRNYNVPDLKDFKLTPYVTREIGEKEAPEAEYDWERDYPQDSLAYMTISASAPASETRPRAMTFLNEWRQSNPQQFEDWVYKQENNLQELIDREKNGEPVNVLSLYRALQEEREKR